MAWTPLERFVEAKNASRNCEDIVVVTANFAAVIDGASDATGAVFAGRSGGRFAAETVAVAIEQLDSDSTSRTFADALSDQLADRVQREAGELDSGTRWPAATVVCLSFERDEIWRVGDCSYRFGDHVSMGRMRVGEAASAFRAALNAALLRSGTSVETVLAEDPGAAAARQLTNVQQHLSNQAGPWGYGCINGRTVPDQFVDVVPVPDDVDEVVLASDGYPSVLPTLDASEQYLRELLEADPCAIDELWTVGKALAVGANSYDDRAYLRLRRSP